LEKYQIDRSLIVPQKVSMWGEYRLKGRFSAAVSWSLLVLYLRHLCYFLHVIY